MNVMEVLQSRGNVKKQMKCFDFAKDLVVPINLNFPSKPSEKQVLSETNPAVNFNKEYH